MRIRNKARTYKYAGIASVLLACVFLVSMAVFALEERQTIHILPTSVNGNGWEQAGRAGEQTLGPRATFNDFASENSTYVIFPAEFDERVQHAGVSAQGAWGPEDEMPEEEVQEVLPTEGDTVDTPAIDTVEGEGESVDVQNEEVNIPQNTPTESEGDGQQEVNAPMPDVSMMQYMHSMFAGLRGTVVRAQEGEVEALVEEDSVAQEESVEEVLEAVQDSEVTSGEALESEVVESEVGADAVPSSEPVDEEFDTVEEGSGAGAGSRLLRGAEDDMRVCAVRGVPCHTLEFTGFDIGSVLSDYEVYAYVLRLSLGAKVIGESFTPDTILVRYYYRGSWHVAGQIDIEGEVSNALNDDHFSFPLPQLEGWDALKDFKVELEVVRNGVARTEVYVDSAWVDVAYSGSGKEELPKLVNLVEELVSLEESRRPDLLVLEDERIDLTRMDTEPSGDLVVRSDMDVYSGLTSARMYISITNRTDTEEYVHLRTHMSTHAELVSLQERVLSTTEQAVSQYGEVAYFCESGWKQSDEGTLQGELEEPLVLEMDQEVQAEQDSQGEVGVTEEVVASVEAGTSATSNTPEVTDTPEDTGELESSGTASTPTDVVLVEEEAVESLEEEVVESVDNTLTNLTQNGVQYSCDTTGVSYVCDSFNGDGTNCIVSNERIDVVSEEVVHSVWQDMDFSEVSPTRGRTGILGRFGIGVEKEEDEFILLSRKRSTVDPVRIAPQETRFFAVEVSFPVQRAGEFVVEAVGDESRAVRTVWWRSGYGYRMPVTIARTATGEVEVPLLQEVLLGATEADVFSEATLDGSDVRFYDPETRSELPVKEFAFGYVDQRAEYGVELPQASKPATTTIYMYYGGTETRLEKRVLAPSVASTFLPYFKVAGEDDGVLYALRGVPTGAEAVLDEEEEVVPLYAGTAKQLFIESGSTLRSRSPVLLARTEDVVRADADLELFEDTHVSEEVSVQGAQALMLERYRLVEDPYSFGEIEALPIPAVGIFEARMIPFLERIKYLRDLRVARFHTFRESLHDMQLGERPEFKMKYRAQKNRIGRFLRGFFRERLEEVQSVRLLHDGVPVEGARFETIYDAEGEWTLRLTEIPRSIIPGKYTVEITVDEIGTDYTDAFDFYWGVLAVNTPKSIYEVGELAEFHMAALDDRGDTLCEADLRLTITAPSGESEERPVEPQSTCGPNNVTDSPDYLAWYRPNELGTYTLSLTHINIDGEMVHQVSDSFEVREPQPFVIERRGATRIWPKASYVMEIALTATNDFEGTFVEAMPVDFIVLDAGGAESSIYGGAKRLTWDVSLEVGETTTLSYEYDAPDISPYLYLLGPAEVRGESGLPFVETRQWKLASDALGSYVELSQTITLGATGWQTVDLSSYGVPANVPVEIVVMNNVTNQNRTGGARAVGSVLNRYFAMSRVNNAAGYNSFPLMVQTNATSSIQLYASNITDITFRLVGYWTSGTFTERMQVLTLGAVDGWRHTPLSSYGVSDGNLAEIVLGNDQNADYIAGVRSASSTLASTDRRFTLTRRNNGNYTLASFFAIASSTSAGVEVYRSNTNIDGWLSGFWSTLPEGMRYVEAYSTIPNPGTATVWTDTALDGFGLGKYTIADVLMANGVNSGNVIDHGLRSNGSSLSRTIPVAQARAATTWNPARMHIATDNTASSTIENYVSATANANFRLLGYWRPADYSTEAPILYDIPFDNEKTGSSTPYLEFSVEDPDGSSDIVYQVQWDDDADLDVSPLGDRESDDESGCSPNCFENVATPADTSPFTESERIRFTIQTPLTSGTTYYWRVRANDVNGSNIYGNWSEVRSFTYIEDTTVKGWFQTEDTQFESGILSDVVTYGAHSVRISNSPPVGAMVAYGEGAGTVPRYKTWNGTVWSGEGSAGDVGGQISWTVLRSAPTRNEYVLGTHDTGNDVNVQVYNGATWGNLLELEPELASVDSRGFDVAYLSQSGTAVAVSCYNRGTNYDATFSVWNGTSWSATTTIDLQFNAPCYWITLASSPASDELVLVAQAGSANTTGDFEAQVFKSGGWSNSYTGGVNTIAEDFFERMAVTYEGDGNEAVIVLGNGGGQTPGIVGAVWSSVNETWTAYTSRNTQDDFEWGEMVQMDDTNDIGLCYTDEDAQVQIANWNGVTNAWDTYVAGTFQADADGKGNGTYHARPISCQYENTAGRAGYLMLPYSDETAARYRVWTGSAFAGVEQSISTIEDSWMVGSARTGDGKILAVFRDDLNDRHDFSYWNGASWSARETLESSMADDTQPFANPIMLAAQQYQDSSGSILSPLVDFDSVAGRTEWGEVTWRTTEPANTGVTLQVLYATSTDTCETLVQEGDLPGNGAGFDVSQSPLDISSLSTSTNAYNKICLRATLTSQTGQSPSLDDWAVSWERQPFLTQEHYGWFANQSTLALTDPWPQGGTNIAETTPISVEFTSPKQGDVLRLRLALKNDSVPLTAGSQAYTLQYAEGAVCSAPGLFWSDVASSASTTAVWRGYENSLGSQSWYDENWPKRIAVTVNASEVDDNLTDFPVYVDLSDLPSTFWSGVKEGGGDIRVTASNGITELAREVVSASTTPKTGELHFKATSTSSTVDTTYYIYYGNASASDYASTSAYGSRNVWTNGYSLRYHLGNNPTVTAPQFQDSTSNTRHATARAGMTAGDVVPGKIGTAIDLDGDDGGTFTQLSYSGPFTASMWWYSSVRGGGNADGFAIAGPAGAFEKMGPWESPAGRMFARTVSSSDTGVNSPTDNTWAHVVLTRDSNNKVDVYINGTATRLYSDLAQSGNSRWENFGGETSQGFEGVLDELRFANVARSSGWITTEYNNQNNPDTFYTVGAQETLGGTTLSTPLLTTSDVAQSYEEENDSTLNPRTIPVGEEGEWDWVIQNNGALPGTQYCFRMIRSDGSLLGGYTAYPQLITNSAPNKTSNLAPFDFSAFASLTPALEFEAEDPESNDLHYQVQIDTDFLFGGSPVLDRNSQDHFTEFSNLVTPADKSPFNSGQRVRFIPTTGLSNNTTYWWRVRARDSNGANAWGAWSEPTSFTVNSAINITTWHQTSIEQFERNTNSKVESASPGDLVLETGEPAGTSTSPAIRFDWKDTGNAWGELDWTDDETVGIIRYRVEYTTGGVWALIPDSALPNNSIGFTAGNPISLLGVDPSTYSEIRLRANLADSSGSPRLLSWTVSWGLAVSQSTQLAPFDNEKVSTTTPSFQFYSEDPQGDPLIYQIEWASTPDFASPTTRSSNTDLGFENVASSTDVSPFTEGDAVRFRMQPGDALTDGNTYWWRVRARDPAPGDDVWSVWTVPRSVTVDTNVSVSTWFQTTDEQFETDMLNSIETYGADTVRIDDTIREAMMVYGEGVVQTPRYRLWNGTTWGNERSAQNIGERVYWTRLASAPTRDEYLLATMGLSGAVSTQIYSGASSTFHTLTSVIPLSASVFRRSFDVAYETATGKGMVVACSGNDAVFQTWNGVGWTATSSVGFTFTNNCDWVQLRANPGATSNEIMLVARADIAETPSDYQARVWNGSAWVDTLTLGSSGNANAEGVAIEYESDGSEALIAVSNGTGNNFLFARYDSGWSATSTVAIANDFRTGTMRADPTTNRVMMCYTDTDGDTGYLEWSGSAWATWVLANEFETTSNSVTGPVVGCEYENTSGREGNVLIAYSDATNAQYRVYDRTTPLTAELPIDTVGDSYANLVARTGDNLILAVFYEDDLTDYTFSSWDGTGWSLKQTLESTSIANTTPRTVPSALSARRYPAVNTGSVISTPIHFSDGAGPKWDYVDWNDVLDNDSTIRYQVEYTADEGETWGLVPDGVLSYNSAGTSTGPWDISNLNYNTYGTLRLVANFVCDSGDCPTLNDWTVAWAEGVSVSGTAKGYDQTTNVTSGTVGVAVNGVVQAGKTGEISGGTWSIPNVTVFPNDVVHVFMVGASEAGRAVAVTKYTGIELYERHLSIGSDSLTTITNDEISLYDNTVAGSADSFFEVDASNNLAVCAVSGCYDARLYVRVGNVYRPDTGSSGNITTHDVDIRGTFIGDNNAITVSGSWYNTATSTVGGTVTFTATSTAEVIIEVGAMSGGLGSVVFGSGSGAATWTLYSPLTLTGNLTISYGTLVASTSPLTLPGNLAIGVSGGFVKGSATTTFTGTGIHTITDNTSPKQDLGILRINGTSKTVRLASGARVTDLLIETGNTFDVSANNYDIQVGGTFTNTGTFTARAGTITFTATSSTRTVTPGASSFANMVWNGVGGNWAFPTGNVTATGNVTIENGIVAFPTGTFSIGGSLTVVNGQFANNNGTVAFTSTTGGRTITPANSSFDDVTFTGNGGAWSFAQANATTTNDFSILAGTVTLPSGNLVVGGDYTVSGAGSFAHNDGTVTLIVQRADTVQANGSPFATLRIRGEVVAGGWYGDDWAYRIPVTIASSSIDDDLANFPVYVDLSTLPESFFDEVKSDGGDIRVTDSTGMNEVPREVVSVNTTTNVGELYFRATNISSSTPTTYYIYYGNPAENDYAVTDTYGARKVWSNGYVLVNHMGDLTTSTTLNSAGTINGSKTSANNPLGVTTGRVYSAQDVSADSIQHAGSILTNATSYSVSLWFNADALTGGTSDEQSYGRSLFGISPTSPTSPYQWLTAGGAAYPTEVRICAYENTATTCRPTSGAGLATGSWYYVSTNAINGGLTTVRINDAQRLTYTNDGESPVRDDFTIGDLRPGRGINFDGRIDEVRVASTTRTIAWQSAEYRNVASSSFYSVGTPELSRVRTFVDTNATVRNDLTIENGGVAVFPTGTLTLGGSLSAVDGAFDARSGSVLFNASTTGHSVAAGISPFNVVSFTNTLGGWEIVQNATSSGAWNIVSADDFTVASGVTVEVGGTFSNSTPNTTDWTGSTLYLNSGTEYVVGSRTSDAETYGTLRIGAGTLVRMWKSDASSIGTVGTGALYSQDHGNSVGDLNIYGTYTRTTGADHWSHATDFDGTDITSTPRQATVRFADGASARFTGATLHIAGAGSTTKTTIERISTGSFGWSLTNSTLDASFFDASGMDSAGLLLQGSTTISSLRDGVFTLTTHNGSMLTVASTTINHNPAYQPMRLGFSTSTGITAGANASTTGTTTSYWWFRDHTGNFDGESYDRDIANPGMLRWDDSGFTVSISGNAYASEGGGGAASSCGTHNVRLVVNGTTPYTTTCNGTTGAFTFPAVTFTGDATLVAYLDTGGGVRGVTVSRTPQGNITGFDIYQNRVIVRHEDTAPLTIAQMLAYDSDQDTDIPFDAETGTLTVAPEVGLFVWGGKTFAPGGDVTLLSGGSGALHDGALRLGSGAVFTAVGTETHSIGGGWIANTGATFNAGNSTVVFTATTTGKTLAPSSPFYTLTFTGTGGWIVASSTVAQNNMTVSAGTVSGTANVTVENGALAGDGTMSMTGGTVAVESGTTFGGNSPWSFSNLTFGDGSASTTSKVGTGDIAVTGVLTISSAHTLEAGGVNWILSGNGSPFTGAGVFTPQTSTTTFSGTGAVSVPARTYHNLVFAPTSGTPIHTLQSGSLSASTLTVGNGANAVTVQADTSDPLITVSGDVRIRANATYSAAGGNDILIGGSYVNEGTFTHNGGGVVLNGGSVGLSVTPGNSSFRHLTFNNASGGWTITGSATTTGNFALTSATSFTQANGSTLAVQGLFTNNVGGGSTEWAGTTLHLTSGTSYTINSKTAGGDLYGTLRVGASTHIRSWDSSATLYDIASSGSLYSQDHAGQSGDLNVWGNYTRSTGADYWSHATDFDGTNISSSTRSVQVRIADNATTTLSGGTLEILGGDGATTTIESQGAGTYALAVTGGTLNAQRYRIRDTSSTGLTLSGSPTITSLSNGDYLLEISGGSMLTVAGSVIDANQVKLVQNVTFATSTGVSSGYNVTATGVSASSWRFIPGSGNYYGEQYDNDSAPDPDPGYLIFSDSDDEVSITGTVYRNEEDQVSQVCDGITQSVALVIEGSAPQTTSCASGTGLYSFPVVSGYAPGDTVLVYLTGTTTKAVHVTQDILSSITLDLYEHRVIVAHEDEDPMTIAGLAVYDVGESADIPYTASTSTSPDSLTLLAGHKLIVREGKTFEPGGDVTLLSGVPASYDGTLALENNASYISSVSTSESLIIGGSLEMGLGSVFTAGTSTVTFTATSSGKTVDVNTSTLHNLVFSGSGGAWTFVEREATTTGNISITAGSVTLGTTSLAVGGSFENQGTLSAASTTFTFSGAGVHTVAFGGYPVGTVRFVGTGAFAMTDTHATSTGSLLFTNGSVQLPTGTFAIKDTFDRTGGAFTHAGTIRLYGGLSAQTIRLGGNSLNNLLVDGSGSWVFADSVATTTGTTTIRSGSLTGPAVRFAVGGSFVNAGTFNANAGLLYLFGTTTGLMMNAGGAPLASVTFEGVGGGWTIATSTVTSGAWRMRQGAGFVMASSTTLEVQGVFENQFAGTATDWTNSVLYLNASGTAYTINTKGVVGDMYAYLSIGSSTDVRMWNSAGATTTVASNASLYSMNNNGVAGSLYIYGEYVRASGSDHWSYATDFDGLAPSGGSRQVNVRIASSSSLTFTGGLLSILGAPSNVTTIETIGGGSYAWSVSGGQLSAEYYRVRNLDANGLMITGTPIVSSLSNGDWELATEGGSLITVASTVIDQNPTKNIAGVQFAIAGGITTGFNVKRTGVTNNFWDFTGHSGSRAGEAYDDDGGDACGSIRWDDSTCLEVSQSGFRFRADNGGGGAPDSEWLNADWSKRIRLNVSNPNAVALTDAVVRFDVAYQDGMQSNFIDLRFTDAFGTTSLPYSIESYTSSATATVWVKVPYVPASSFVPIYAYYDNVFATNGESGADTFLFFDDFEDGSLSEYSGPVSTYFSASASFAKQGSYGLNAATGKEEDFTTPSGIYRTGTGNTFGRDTTIRWYQYVDATKDDEPCTLFGVQTPGSTNQNYGVCLDQYPVDNKLILVKNISSNDGSGTVLASTTVSYSTGWYTVEADWRSNNTIFVSLYNSAGSLVATTTASDSTHTTGGMGFSYWYQSGGWDHYTVRSYTALDPTATLVGLPQERGGASWLGEENASVSLQQDTPFRVRFAIENSGPEITGQQVRLQYADKTGYGTCNAVPSVSYDDVPNASGCGVSPVCMVTTSGYADGDATQPLLASTANHRYIDGKLVQSPSNQTASMSIGEYRNVEFEYAVELTSFATSDSYCMRTSNGGLEFDSYQRIAEVTGKYGPQITSWSLNSTKSISLVEGQTHTVYATGTVADLNGYEDLLYATTTVYRSGVGRQCASDPNNCYQLNSLQCQLSDCSGTTCAVSCEFEMQFFADPTDNGSLYNGEHWEAVLYVTDTGGEEATSTSEAVEVQTMSALSLANDVINYGALEMDQDTDLYNPTVSVRNTGNSLIDIDLEGTDMTSGASTIPVGNQKFATSSFAYSECDICTALTGSVSTVNVDMPKQTSTSTPVYQDLYWGIYVPTDVAGTTHYGQTTFYARGY